MSHPRRTRGGGPKTYADLCENCEPMTKSPSTSKLSQVRRGRLQVDLHTLHSISQVTICGVTVRGGGLNLLISKCGICAGDIEE